MNVCVKMRVTLFLCLPCLYLTVGETIEAAAKREVKEECGMDVIVGKAFSASNVFQYDESSSLADPSSSEKVAAVNGPSSSPGSTVFSSGAVSTVVSRHDPRYEDSTAASSPPSLSPSSSFSSSSSSSSSSMPSVKYHFGIVHVLAVAAHHAHLQASLPCPSSSSPSSLATLDSTATSADTPKPADDAVDVQWVAIDQLLGTASDHDRNSFGGIMISPLTPGLLEVVEMGQAILRHAPHLWAAQQGMPPAR